MTGSEARTFVKRKASDMPHPPLEEFQELIRTQDKRPALRGLYKKYGVTSPTTRAAYNKLWDALRDEIPDAYVTPQKEFQPLSHRDDIERAVVKARKRTKKKGRKKRTQKG